MAIGARIRQLRMEKQMSQGDIEEKTGLLRCYISRVENGHTVPSLETLERFAGALDVPVFMLFYIGDAPSKPSLVSSRATLDQLAKTGGKKGEDARFLLRLRELQPHLSLRDREVLLDFAKKLAEK